MLAHKSQQYTMAALCLTVFIDGMGFSIALPIFSALFLDSNTVFFVHSMSHAKRSLLFGLTNAVYMLCCFLGFVVLGKLSDNFGRKRILIVCLVGTSFGYLLLGLGVLSRHLSWLIAGRIIDGVTAGSQSVARAASIDLSVSTDMKRRYLARLLCATTLGLTLGPMIGGELANPKLISWFNYATPFYFAGVLALLNAFMIRYVLQETRSASRSLTYRDVMQAIQEIYQHFVEAFGKSSLRKLGHIYLWLEFSWVSFVLFLPSIMLHHFHYSIQQNANFLAWFGFSLSIGFFPKSIVIYGNLSVEKRILLNLLCLVVSLSVMLISSNPTVYWIGCFPVGFCGAVSFNDLLFLISNQVSAAQQGWIMGIFDALASLVMCISSLLNAAFIIWMTDLPIIDAIFTLLLALFLMVKFVEYCTEHK